MQRKRVLSTFVLLFLILFFIQACSVIFPSESESDSNQKIEIDAPLYKNSKEIKVHQRDLEQLKIDLFGYEQTLYANSMEVRVTEDIATDVYADLEDQLIDEGWRYQSSFFYEAWQKGDEVLFLYFEDNLTSEMINNYRRSYGIESLEPGQTMIISYVFDFSAPQPNPTLTKAVEIWSMTETADAMQSTQNAIEANRARTQQALEWSQEETQQALEWSQEETQQALEWSQEQTQQAFNQTQQAITLTQQSYDAATQTALEEQKRVESMRATATAIAPILELMGTEFDGEDSLPSGMFVAREDHTRWDSSTKQGWLHMIGRYTDLDRANYIPKNVFVYPLDYSNISIITRVDGNMSKNRQYIGLGLTPSTYETDNFTVMLGIRMTTNSGRGAYAWGCFKDRGCAGYYVSSYDYNFYDQIGFSGPVFLRLDIQELKYTFYYSENGVDWIYLGKIEGYSAGDNIILHAGGTGPGNSDAEFDAYFDFIRFVSIVNQ